MSLQLTIIMDNWHLSFRLRDIYIKHGRIAFKISFVIYLYILVFMSLQTCSFFRTIQLDVKPIWAKCFEKLQAFITVWYFSMHSFYSFNDDKICTSVKIMTVLVGGWGHRFWNLIFILWKNNCYYFINDRVDWIGNAFRWMHFKILADIL